MFKSTEPVLPLDTIGNIIDFLIKDNAKGLQYVKTCSLVCQSFLPLCRTHIFSSIKLKITCKCPVEQPQPHDTERFGQLLLETPEIARSIRHLNIVIIELHSTSGHFFNQVPRQLTRLKSLSLRPSEYWCMYNVDWNDISSPMQRSLVNFVHLPTLTHLNLVRITNFPISVLIACTNLEQLSAKSLYIVIDEHDDLASSLSHRPMQLRELDIEISKRSDALSLLTARYPDGRTILDFSGLKKISVSLFVPSYGVQTREIFRTTQQLTEVRLEVNNEVFLEIEFAKLVTPSLQTLRRVHFSFNVEDESEDPLAGLCEELEKISGKNRLESIEIIIHLLTDDCYVGDAWGNLEKVLLQPGWPMLKRVSLAIIIFVYTYDSPFKGVLERLRETQFSGLVSSKKLDFQFSVHEEEH